MEKIARSQVGDFGSFLWLFDTFKAAILLYEPAVSQGPSSVQHFRSLPSQKKLLFFVKISKFSSKFESENELIGNFFEFLNPSDPRPASIREGT